MHTTTYNDDTAKARENNNCDVTSYTDATIVLDVICVCIYIYIYIYIYKT